MFNLPSLVMLDSTPIDLSGLLTAIGTVISNLATNVPVMLQAILASPVFQIGVGIWFGGACIGIASRLLSTK